MNLDILPIGLYQENIYVVHENKHVMIIDPGAHAKEIMKCIQKDEAVDGIILTHGHEDHTGVADDLVDQYHCPLYMHPMDFCLVDPNAGRDMLGYTTPVYSKIEPLQPEMKIGVFKIKVYHTPGHTAGSCCIQYKNVLFAGDTLFAGSCGRTDLYSGNEYQMAQSLKFLKTLPQDLIVYPGHGPSTTIHQEVMTNMFMRGL